MTEASELAINGGPKAKTHAYGTGKRFIGNEIQYLQEALDQNGLFYGSGQKVKQACKMMVDYTGMPYVVPCSSGSAAVHLGLIAASIGAGDEVICTPNTDSGSILGVIEEGAVPIFCDCEDNLQPSVETIAAKMTDRTTAVVVVHLAGYPAPVDKIVAFCEPKGIAVVEDCAQSWGTTLNGQMVGSFGTAGCYSTNDFKHISTGDGGFVALRDEALYRRVSNYSDKHYDRLFGRGLFQAHHGMNYRMSELQGAVAVAQLEKVDTITSRQHDRGDLLTSLLQDLKGATIVPSIPGGYSTYWWSVLRIDLDAITVGRQELLEALKAEGIGAGSYEKYDLIQKPLFQNRQVRPWLEGDRAMYPFVQPDGRRYTYSVTDTPNHKKLLNTGIMISISTWHTVQDMEENAAGILKVFSAYLKS